jgi:hypothetical protein
MIRIVIRITPADNSKKPPATGSRRPLHQRGTTRLPNGRASSEALWLHGIAGCYTLELPPPLLKAHSYALLPFLFKVRLHWSTQSRCTFRKESSTR